MLLLWAAPVIAATEDIHALLHPVLVADSANYELPKNTVKQHEASVPILEDLGGGGGGTSIPVSGGPIVFITYFNSGLQLILEIAVGMATLWVLISGGQIMLSGGGAQKDAAIERMKYAVVGLIGLIFVGVLLKFLNASFFV